jgi:hypothetical protein
MNDKQKQFLQKAEELVQLAGELNYGDPYAAGRMREIILASKLGHTLHHDLHGEDAKFISEDSKVIKVEYKTNFESFGIKGRYDVSWQPTWEDQVYYLETEKIGDKKFHYFATFTIDYTVAEVYELSGEKVLEILLPQFEKKYNTTNSEKKNRGLYATLGQPDIKKYGKHIHTSKISLMQFF